jgi:hypothetical protein
LGISLAQHAKSAIGEDNRSGYFEDLDLARNQDYFLKQFDSHWAKTTHLTVDIYSIQAKNTLEYISNYLKQGFLDTDTLCIKDPRICRLLPLWLAAAQDLGIDVKTITLVRDPEQVSASLHRRDSMPLLQGKLLWLRYYIEALDSIVDKNNITIFFDEVVKNPETLKHALETLGIKHNNAAIETLITAELINQKASSNDNKQLQQISDHRKNNKTLLSILNQWFDELAKTITIEDYSDLINYTYTILGNAADHERKIRNLEWSIKNNPDRKSNTFTRIITRLFG